MGPALAVGHEGAAEIFDVDCTAPITRVHLDRANALLPEGVRLLDARPLLQGAPSLGKLIDAVRYRLAAPGSGAWPESPEALDEQLRGAVRRWQPLEDGGLRLEINARQEAGPTPSLKKLLMGIGVDDELATAARATREMLVLRPRGSSARERSSAMGAES
jgi:hypothetical protein